MPESVIGLASSVNAITADVNAVIGSSPDGIAAGTFEISTTQEPETPESKTKTKRTRKTNPDPNAPRKPMTSYFLFAAEERKKIRDERNEQNEPALTNTEMTLELAKRWGNLKAEGQELWRQVYLGHLEKYKVEKQLYEENLTLQKNGTDEADPSIASPTKSKATKSTDSSAKQSESTGTPAKKSSKKAPKRKPSTTEKEALVATSSESAEPSTSETPAEPSKKKQKKSDKGDKSEKSDKGDKSEKSDKSDKEKKKQKKKSSK